MTTDATFEPSGIVWHSGRSQLIAVGDEGQVAIMNADGSNVTLWNLGNSYDLEDVTISDATSSFVYLLDENTSSALQFDLTTGSLTGKSWSFSDKISEVNGAGAEGLTWASGSFYVGWQYDGDIYVYSANLDVSGSQTFTQEIHMTTGYTDISGLAFSSDTQRIYALYDGLDLLEERTLDGTLQASYSVPGSNQEGVTLINSCAGSLATMVIAEDSGAVMSYSGYPISCLSSVVSTPVVTVTSVVGTTNGDVSISYSNETSVLVDVFSLNSKSNTNVQWLVDDYYVAYIGRYAAIVDASDSSIYASTIFQKGSIYPKKWARSVLGI